MIRCFYHKAETVLFFSRLLVFGVVSKQVTELVVAVKIEELKLVCMFVCLFVFDATAPSGPAPPYSDGF
jgi:hypothetical protein